MGLNIKNRETDKLVSELAKLTGENKTEAITKAVRERLDRVRRRKRSGGLAEELMRIGRECAAHLEEPLRSAEHGDLIYDENGLPK